MGELCSCFTVVWVEAFSPGVCRRLGRGRFAVEGRVLVRGGPRLRTPVQGNRSLWGRCRGGSLGSVWLEGRGLAQGPSRLARTQAGVETAGWPPLTPQRPEGLPHPRWSYSERAPLNVGCPPLPQLPLRLLSVSPLLLPSLPPVIPQDPRGWRGPRGNEVQALDPSRPPGAWVGSSGTGPSPLRPPSLLISSPRLNPCKRGNLSPPQPSLRVAVPPPVLLLPSQPPEFCLVMKGVPPIRLGVQGPAQRLVVALIVRRQTLHPPTCHLDSASVLMHFYWKQFKIASSSGEETAKYTL